MRRSPTRSARVATTALAVVAAGSLLGVGLGASQPVGAEGGSAREQRAAVRAQKAEVASQVDALQADQADVTAALAVLDDNVRGQEASLANARAQAEAAAAEAARADVAAAQTSEELVVLRAKVAAYAVAAYVEPPGEDLLTRFEASSAQDDATRQAFLEVRAGRDADTVDQLRSAQHRLEDERDRADRARSEAESHAADAETALASLTDAKAQQQAFAEEVRSRLDDRLADAAYLGRMDAELGRTIAAEEAALAAAVARAAPTVRSATSRPAPKVSRPPLATVGEIKVATSIAPQLTALMAAAQADGIFLGGYGYRDVSVQVALRRQNCGTSDDAIWYMPPEQCSPPTARPGSSLHEQGLAVDFSVNGRFIKTHSDDAFVWLAANAGRFGFSNLPSEPWHWSTTGG